MKKVIKFFYTIFVAAFLGVAKSFGYKTEFKEHNEDIKIEGSK